MKMRSHFSTCHVLPISAEDKPKSYAR